MPRIVESTFNIFKHGRLQHNNRPYLLNAVKRIIDSPKTQEALKLGELVGYWGHGGRLKTNKLQPQEMEIVTIDGKQVALTLEPSNVCVELSIDDEGNVKHKQKILDTNAGKVVDALEASQVGGWSWAISGDPDNISGFGGFDYVKKPSYIDNEKRTKLMLESLGCENVEQAIIHNLKEQGLSEESSQLILESWEGTEPENTEQADLAFKNLMLESVIQDMQKQHSETIEGLKEERENESAYFSKKKALMLEGLNSLPVIPTEEQKAAFASMETAEDIETVKNMFESVAEKMTTLPLMTESVVTIPKEAAKSSNVDSDSEKQLAAFTLNRMEGNPFKG